MSEPDWNDVASAKQWLEQRFTGSTEAGSPLYQYLIDLGAKGAETDWREEHLSTYELLRWLKANAITSGIHYPSESRRIMFYPEYKYPGLSSDQQTQSTVTKDQKTFKPPKKGSAQKRTSGMTADVRSLKQPKTSKQLKRRLPKKPTANKIEHKSKDAKKMESDRLPQAEPPKRTLRPRTEGRRRCKTDFFHPDNHRRTKKII